MTNTRSSAVLDLDQLRDITMNDAEMMRDIVSILIDDTSRNAELLEAAIRDEDGEQCMRLAHYSKGACANVGANAAAEVFLSIERQAKQAEFQGCAATLAALAGEIDQLRAEASAF